MKKISDEVLHFALRVLRTLCCRFDHGGESMRSERARLTEAAFRLLKPYDGVHIEPLELWEQREFIATMPPQGQVEYQFWLSSELVMLSNHELAILILGRQSELMENEAGLVRIELTVAIQKALSVSEYYGFMLNVGFDQYSNEQLLLEASDRLFNRNDAFIDL